MSIPDMQIPCTIIFIISYTFLFLPWSNGDESNKTLSSPNVLSSTRSSFKPTAHRIQSFQRNSFTKIHVVGGPFDLQLCDNNKSTSVEIHTEKPIQTSILIDIVQKDVLLIRMIENLSLLNKTKIIITINYSNFTELRLDGMINVRCLNPIRTNRFLLHQRGTGLVKLKLNVNILDAYLHSTGRMKLCGQVNEEATLHLLGVGDVQCGSLFSKKINVISSGIGNIHVTATDEVNIILTGIGTVYYTGPLRQHIRTGLGNIIEGSD